MFLPTANEYVALPNLAEDGSLASMNVLHMGLRGLLEVTGSPLLKPLLRVDGAAVQPELHWQRRAGFIPEAGSRCGDISLTLTYLCPAGQRGWVLRYTVMAQAPVAVEWGAELCWQATRHTINVAKPLEGHLCLYHSDWNQGPVLDLRLGATLLALAPQAMETPLRADDHAVVAMRRAELAAGESATLTLFVGVGLEEVGAVAAAREMQRTGYAALLADTEAWLAARSVATEPVLQLNLLFNRLFATGRTLDTEELVLVTSRSPRYYVSAAFWDRDSLLWSLPALVLSDPACAREALEYYFRRQIGNAGVHSRYIDGVVLEPGFELDELMAPLIAVEMYVAATGDLALLRECDFFRHCVRLLRLLAARRHPAVELYSTSLLPSDDVPTYPYCTYDNVLVWRGLHALARLVRLAPELGATLAGPQGSSDQAATALAAQAEAVAAAVREHCVAHGRYAWEVDLAGGHRFYDEPPGSLQMLAPFGFCAFDDPVYLNTVAWIRSPESGYAFVGTPFAELGCAHAAHPWVLAAANALWLPAYRDAAADLLRRAELDGGVACESIDEQTGRCVTGAAFATCAGYLAYSLWQAAQTQPVAAGTTEEVVR